MTAIDLVTPPPGTPTPSPKPRAAWLALGLPCAGLLIVGLLGRIAGSVIVHTLVGMVGTAVGGIAAGVTAQRFIAHGKSSGEVVFGIGATTAIGVVAIGYIYLFYIENAMSTILTLARNVEQTFIFVEFFTAQYAGTLWARRFFPVIRGTN
ncbi:MAG TPA: hypothetical protein PLH19_03270 [Anaerolineae bacterium]|nr:hypothetical protein [Anaerolineae bacterium]HQH37541.1 hypothetical protein [Anaerolineae bacterium]